MKRKFFSIITALALCLGLLPVTAQAYASGLIVGGMKMEASETPIYAKTDQEGVTILESGTEDSEWNIKLTKEEGIPCLTLRNANLTGAVQVKNEYPTSLTYIERYAGIFCDGTPLKMNLIGTNTVTAISPDTYNTISAVFIKDDLTITGEPGGALTISSAEIQKENNSGSINGLFVTGSLTVSGSAEVVAKSGSYTKGTCTGAAVNGSITVSDYAKLAGIGGTAFQCTGIACEALSASDYAEVSAFANSGDINAGLSLSKPSSGSSSLSVTGNARVYVDATGGPKYRSMAIDPNTPENRVPITLSDNGQLEIYGDVTSGNGYAFGHGMVTLYYSGGYFIASSTSDISMYSYNGFAASGSNYIYRISKDDEFECSSSKQNFGYKQYVEIATGYAVTAESFDGNMGTVTGGGVYKTGSAVTVEAVPAAGYKFVEWTKNGSQVSTDAKYTFDVAADRNLTAVFAEILQYTVTVAASPAGRGTVTGGGTYEEGASITVEAAPNSGYRFVKWMESGGEASADKIYTFIAGKDRDLTAVFEEVPVGGITLSSDSLALAEGKKGQLTAAAQPEGAAAPSITWSSSDPTVASVDENGVVTALKAGTVTITATAEGGFTASCTVTVNPVEDAPVRPPELPADTDDKMLKVEVETGLSEVPAALAGNEELNTPAKIEKVLKTQIQQINSAIPEANTAVYDVALMVSTDGGRTWVPATEENFPNGGLTVTLPYPEGTNSSYQFTVVHMFTSDIAGKTPGKTETPPVTNTADGIRFTVTGLSPISVGWAEPVPMPVPGSGISVSTYPVTVEGSGNGSVVADRRSASAGSTVIITATPDEGYILDTLTVIDGRGGVLELTGRGDGRYAFTMPSGAVTVRAAFVRAAAGYESCPRDESCPIWPYTDARTTAWYHDGVHHCIDTGLMRGYDDGTFRPDAFTSRSMIATILWRLQGSPVVNYSMEYRDVDQGAWYAEAVRWAASEGIVTGYGGGLFGPDDPITREQMAVMLWRYAGSPAAVGQELRFTDAGQISGFALEAMKWASANGIISGYEDGALDPRGSATRAQAAQMLKNFSEGR